MPESGYIMSGLSYLPKMMLRPLRNKQKQGSSILCVH